MFRAIGRDLIFDGFLRVWQEEEQNDGDDEPQSLPPLAVNELLDVLALIPKQHFTQPPGRYTESALVKALEERGIGRPSTYAAIIKTLKDRAYVILAPSGPPARSVGHGHKRMLSPTPLAEATCDALTAAFPDVMYYAFTAQVEDWLDDVSRGERDWVNALRDFYDPFAAALASAPPKMAAFKGQYSSAAALESQVGTGTAESAESEHRHASASAEALEDRADRRRWSSLLLVGERGNGLRRASTG